MIREDFVRIVLAGLLGLRCFPRAPSLPPAPSSVDFLFLATPLRVLGNRQSPFPARLAEPG